MKNLLLLSLLLISSPVWADCKDFEDCMAVDSKIEAQKKINREYAEKNPNSFYIGGLTGFNKSECYLKALCYKLDEISKKMDEKNTHNCYVDNDYGKYKKPYQQTYGKTIELLGK